MDPMYEATCRDCGMDPLAEALVAEVEAFLAEVA